MTSPLILLLAVACAWLVSCSTTTQPAASAKTKGQEAAGASSALSGKIDIPMLVPTGLAAAWPLQSLNFDEDGQPSYSLSRTGRMNKERAAVGISAVPVKPELPRTKSYGTYEQQVKAVDYSREVFIPAFGRKVAWYLDAEADGTQNTVYKTVPVAWPDAHGGTLYYVIEVETTSRQPADLIRQVKWAAPGAWAGMKVQKGSQESSPDNR